MKWIAGVCLVAVIVGAVATITIPAATVQPDREILKLFPPETQGVAFIDVAGLRNAVLVQEMLLDHRPNLEKGDLAELLSATGFVPERDLDRVTAGRIDNDKVMAVVEARYDRLKFEQFMRDKNIPSETYQGWVIYRPDKNGPSDYNAVAFVDNLVIVGRNSAVRGAIERKAAPAPSILDNATVMDEINTIEAGNQIWAAGRFTADQIPFARGGLGPANELLKAMQSGTYQMRIDQDVRVRAKGDFADVETARNLTDSLRGLISVAKIQLAQEPDIIRFLEGVRVDVEGSSMIVNVDAPGELIKKLPHKGIQKKMGH